ncbi:MAG: MarR family transcriptional regulator [Kofleriaceae bacterium]|nr:MarR family transcriptional regulator [Kofleriaceae bacterium]
MTRSRKPEKIQAFAAALTRVAEADRRLRVAAAEHAGLNIADFDAVRYLAEEGPVPAGRIAEAMGITSGAVTGLVDRLERAGWVVRARHEVDRRQVVVDLAPARRELIDADRALRDRLLGDAVAKLDDAALHETASLLDATAEQLLAGAAELARAEGDDADSADADRAPIADAEHGRLRFASGAARLELRGARIKDLYRASFAGKRPQVTVSPSGEIDILYKGISWFGARDVAAQLTLTTSVPWSIEIRKGVSHLAADLRELQIAAIEIAGGASESELSLPRPRGLSTLRVAGGASRLSIRRPRGTAAQVSVRGGASNLTFDAQRLGAVGGPTRLSTPGWDTAPDRWSIELTGGASELSVIEE